MSTTLSNTRPRTSRRHRMRRLAVLAPFGVVAVGAAVAGTLAGTPKGHIAPGVQVGELNLGRKSQEEARTALEQWAATRQKTSLNLRFAPETGFKRAWKVEAQKLGLGVDVQATLDEAAKAGQNGVVGQVKVWIGGAEPLAVAPRPSVDTAKLRAYLKRLAKSSVRSPQNAQLIPLKGSKFDIRPGKPGLALDIEGSANAITTAWKAALAAGDPAPPTTPAASPSGNPTGEQPNGGTPATEPPPPTETPTTPTPEPATPSVKTPLEVELATVVKQPPVTAEALREIDGVLGSYTTHFGGTGASRGNNIAVATKRINGTLLAPGETFSYNRVVGPRVASAGFKEAPVIIQGELVPGIGGGICQVSSTLYNAALLSDLKIVRRSHHAFPVHYLPAGRDATVVDGAVDFQFQNNTPAPLYISASASRGRLSFTLYGKRDEGKTVSIELSNHTTQPAPTETQKDPTLPAGRRVVKDSGHRGHRVTVHRIVRKNGQTVRKELIARDVYRPFPAIVVVGTKPVAPKPTPKTKTPSPLDALPSPPAVTPTPTPVGTPGQ